MVDLERYFILSPSFEASGSAIVRSLGTSTWLLANTLWRLVDERAPESFGNAIQTLTVVAGCWYVVSIGNAAVPSSFSMVAGPREAQMQKDRVLRNSSHVVEFWSFYS